MSIGAVVLAAGQGTRMRSALPKVVHPLAGRPMIDWVLDALARGGRRAHGRRRGPRAREVVRDALPAGRQRGRAGASSSAPGDAARVGLAALDPACDTVVVACGDTPLLPAELVARTGGRARRRAAGGHHADRGASTTPAPTGGCVRAADGTVARVVEARDASRRGAGRSASSTPASTSSTGRALAGALDGPRRPTTPRASSTSPTRSRCSTARWPPWSADDPRGGRGGQRPRRARGLRGRPPAAPARAS